MVLHSIHFLCAYGSAICCSAGLLALKTILFGIQGKKIESTQPFIKTASNFQILSEMSPPAPPPFSSLATVTLGIPVPVIIAHYNLEVGGQCGPRAAAFWAAVAPLVAWLFYKGDLFIIDDLQQVGPTLGFSE